MAHFPSPTLDDSNKVHGTPVCIVQYKQTSSILFHNLKIKLIPHVEVAGDPQAVAVSGKIVPLVHINSIHLVVHNLR